MFTALITALASGAGGGIFGGILGLAKGIFDSKERVKLEELRLKRDELEQKERQADRAHELNLGIQATEQAQIEGEAAAEVANQKALSSANRVEFGGLNTTSGMDNYRSSVRPTLAYWFSVLFNAMLAWAFWKFGSTITQDQGAQILLGLFATLEFIVCSIISFYYVSRRNAKPYL